MIFISQVVLINSFSKNVLRKSWFQTMFRFVYFNRFVCLFKGGAYSR